MQFRKRADYGSAPTGRQDANTPKYGLVTTRKSLAKFCQGNGINFFDISNPYDPIAYRR
jgi:hypothetical protein